MADRRALRIIGLGFAALTVAVTLIGAAVVKQNIDNRPTVALAEVPAVEVTATR